MHYFSAPLLLEAELGFREYGGLLCRQIGELRGFL